MSVVYKHTGTSIDYTPSADVTAGDVIVLGELVGVAKLDIKAGDLGALHVTGVFDRMFQNLKVLFLRNPLLTRQ